MEGDRKAYVIVLKNKCPDFITVFVIDYRKSPSLSQNYECAYKHVAVVKVTPSAGYGRLFYNLPKSRQEHFYTSKTCCVSFAHDYDLGNTTGSNFHR